MSTSAPTIEELEELEEGMNDFLQTTSYDETGDWRKEALTDEDPDDDPDAGVPPDLLQDVVTVAEGEDSQEGA